MVSMLCMDSPSARRLKEYDRMKTLSGSQSLFQNNPRPLFFCKNLQMALPGGFIEPGEQVSLAVRREFGEEALATLELPEAERRRVEKALDKLFKEGQSVYRGYVEDDRNTDNAWIESDVLLYHDDQGDALGDFALRAGDDAKAVQWTMVRRLKRTVKCFYRQCHANRSVRCGFFFSLFSFFFAWLL